MEKINFNELAWNSPKHENGYGYTPNDKYYNEIVEWLRSCKRIWRVKEGNVTTTRLSMENNDYDVIAEFYHENKMISYIFRPSNTFHI